MYDNGLKNNEESPRLDLGVVIYVSLVYKKPAHRHYLMLEFGQDLY